MSAYDNVPAAELDVNSVLMRVLRRMRPSEGWLVYLLALATVLTLPYAANSSQIVPGLAPTIWLAFVGLSFSWWLAYRSRASGIVAALILALTGLVATLGWGVNVLNPWPLTAQVGSWLNWRAATIGFEVLPPSPPITYFGEQWAALVSFGQRVSWWVEGLVSGPGTPDNLVVLWLAGLLVWCFSAWAGWWIARRGESFVALLPVGIVLAQLAFWFPDTRWSLVTFLGATAMLLVMSRLSWLMRLWERTGTDYSPEMRFDMVAIGLVIAAVAMILAPALPFIASNEFSQSFWRIFESPYKEVETRIGRSFEVAQPVRSLVPVGGFTEGGLPRAHLLGGRPELGREVALKVRTRGADPGQSLFWRGHTFANYTGRGWNEGDAEVIETEYAAGQAWQSDLARAPGRTIVNSVEVIQATRGVMYAAGEPISADRPYRARFHPPDALIALSASGRPRQYTVLSHLIVPDDVLLRAAPDTYPSEIAELYLQLPSDLDPRLSTFLEEAAPQALPAYDRALGIEAALRRLEYSLDVPPPPSGRELVSWFLLDLQKGYCDYFASAMVVLARMSGIPARLAIGYAPGNYNSQTQEYTVTEASAHSWPELYFPGIGWLRFEPTPAQEQPLRAASGMNPFPPGDMVGIPDLDSGLAELREMGAANMATERRETAASRLLASLTGLLLAWSLVRLARLLFSPLVAVDGTGGAYGRLVRWGRRLGRPVRPADTPREFLARVDSAAVERAQRARWLRGGARRAAATVQGEAGELVRTYEAARFGPQPEITEDRAGQATRRWVRLWPALRRVWLAR